MSRQAVKFAAGVAGRLAEVLTIQARPKPGDYATQDKLTAWIDFLRQGRTVKLEPDDAKRLVSLMSAVCRPEGPAQRTEFDAIIKRLQGGR